MPDTEGREKNFLENALSTGVNAHAAAGAMRRGIRRITTAQRLPAAAPHGFDDDGAIGRSRAHDAIKVLLHSGIRLAFSPACATNRSSRSTNRVLETLPAELKDWAKPRVHYDKKQLEEDYFALFADLRSKYDNSETRILLSPSWAHGLTEPFARRVVDVAAGKIPIHMHTLQSPVQKAYGLRRHGKPTMQWLDEVGLVAKNVTYGHAIHVTQDDIELMGSRGASVTNHPSCNLIMRNGITPVMQMRKAGQRGDGAGRQDHQR